MHPVNVASVQFQHKSNDKAANLDIIQRFVQRACQESVDLLVFPEMCITGYWHIRNLNREQVAALSEPVPDGPSTQQILQMAKDSGITIGAGLIEKDSNGELYNSYIVAMPDGRVERHRKLHCFIHPEMSSGDSVTVFDIPQGCRVGVLICYDNNIIENVRMTALAGAEILLAPHQTGGCHSRSPHAMKPIEMQLWEKRKENPEALREAFLGPNGRGWLMRWLPARAHDNGLFYIFSNGVGRDDDEIRTGNAMILDPYGRVLAESDAIEEDMVIAHLDPALREMATGLRWMTARRPELYTSLTEKTGKERDAHSARFGQSLDEKIKK